jgi:acyl-CoA thioesterase I
MRRRAVIAALLEAVVVGTLATGCSGGSRAEAPDAPAAAPPQTYVAVGASESVGIGAERPLVEAWPRVLYRTALERNTVLVNAGVEGSTVAEALDVRALRQNGRARVLVANTPPVDQLPAYQALAGSRFPPPDEVRALVAAYNRAIERVTDAQGADLVDLHTEAVRAVEDGTFASLISDDGFHPSTDGHARVAEVFATAL